MGRDDAAILHGRHARVDINLRGIRNMVDIQREGEGRAVEYCVVDGNCPCRTRSGVRDGQNMLLIGGVAFLLGVETEYAEQESNAAPAVAASSSASKAKASE